MRIELVTRRIHEHESIHDWDQVIGVCIDGMTVWEIPKESEVRIEYEAGGGLAEVTITLYSHFVSFIDEKTAKEERG